MRHPLELCTHIFSQYGGHGNVFFEKGSYKFTKKWGSYLSSTKAHILFELYSCLKLTKNIRLTIFYSLSKMASMASM